MGCRPGFRCKPGALGDPRTPAYQDWAHKVQENARELAKECINLGMKLQTGGTDNHLMLIDVTTYGLTGRQAENAMFECGVTLNRNTLPFDPQGPWWTSGIRVGTPAVTTLGMGKEEMKEIASIIDFVLKNTKPGLTKEGKPAKGKIDLDDATKEAAKKRVDALLSKFVLYPELDIDFLKKAFVK